MNTIDKHKLIKLSDKTNKALESIADNRNFILKFTSMNAEQLNLTIDIIDDLAGNLDQVKKETWSDSDD